MPGAWKAVIDAAPRHAGGAVVAHRQSPALQGVAPLDRRLFVRRFGREHLGGGHQAPPWEAPVPPRRFRDEMRSAGAVVLFVSDEHALATAELPYAHRDPFDRLLLGVAEVEHLVLLTADEALIALSGEHPGLPIKSV